MYNMDWCIIFILARFDLFMEHIWEVDIQGIFQFWTRTNVGALEFYGKRIKIKEFACYTYLV